MYGCEVDVHQAIYRGRFCRREYCFVCYHYRCHCRCRCRCGCRYVVVVVVCSISNAFLPTKWCDQELKLELLQDKSFDWRQGEGRVRVKVGLGLKLG